MKTWFSMLWTVRLEKKLFQEFKYLFRYQENSPLENSHPENSHPSNSLLENSPRKIPTQKISTRNIPIHIFKYFVFSMLLPLSLIMVKSLYFCLLKMLKSDLMWCIKKNLAACLLLRKCFGYDRNVFHIFIQEMFNFSKIRLYEKEISKEPEKTSEESFWMLKATFL